MQKRTPKKRHRLRDCRQCVYACADGTAVPTRPQAEGAELTPRNGLALVDHIAHRLGEKSEFGVPHVLVSGTGFSRSMDAIFDGSKRARTVLFPCTIRSVCKYAFAHAELLARYPERGASGTGIKRLRRRRHPVAHSPGERQEDRAERVLQVRGAGAGRLQGRQQAGGDLRARLPGFWDRGVRGAALAADRAAGVVCGVRAPEEGRAPVNAAVNRG